MSSRSRCPAELWTAAQAAAADRATIELRGLPSVVLMERASLAVAQQVRARWNGKEPVWVLVGPGNNGGDGLAVARMLQSWGVPCELILSGPIKESLLAQLGWARAVGVQVHETKPLAPSSAVVIDALLGTGASGKPRGSVLDLLQWQAPIRGLRIAIDVPTGVDVDTGGAVAEAFHADVTVTFVRSKLGLHVTPGRNHAGQVIVADIGIDPMAPLEAAALSHPIRSLIDGVEVGAVLQHLPPGEHKGRRGHVMLMAGGEGTPGAAILAATAAMRSGAGLCTLVGASAAVRALMVRERPELMLKAWTGREVLEDADALVVGPGLTDPDVWPQLAMLYAEDPRPAVWDASALDHVPVGASPAGPRVLTPHPGEAARLLRRMQGVAVPEVQAARGEAARLIADATGAVVVLKGAGTLIATPQGELWIATVGSPALATAGSGDVLAGLIGTLLARGVPARQAACVAVHVHGVAGDRAHADHPSPMAGDIIEAVARGMVEYDRHVDAAWPGYVWA